MKKDSKLTRNRLLRYSLQAIVLGVLASTAVLIYFTKPEQTLGHLREFDWKYAIVCIGVVILAWMCNALRIYLLTRSLGYALRYRQALCISMSMEFGIAATPAGMGGAVIRLSFLRLAGIPVGHSTSTLATDMALDALFFLLLLPFAFTSIAKNQRFLNALPFKEPGDITGTILALLFLLAALVIAVRSGILKTLAHRIVRHPRLLRYRLRARMRWTRWKAAKELQRIRQGIAVLVQMRKGVLLLTFVVSAVQWCCRYGILVLLLNAFQVPTNPVLLFFLQGFLFMTSLAIVLPGGGGGVEVLMALILRQLIPPALVGVVILLWRFFTYYLYLFTGGAVFLYVLSHLNDIFPKRRPEDVREDLNEIQFENSV